MPSVLAPCPQAGRWNDMLVAVDAVRDRRGRPVDPGIRDTVAALNLLGLPTLQSCEGHVDASGHGHAAPWVDLVDEAISARAASLLAVFYADEGSPSDDLRLAIEDGRLANGGGYAALEATRRHLAEGAPTADQLDALRAQLGARQAEMRRFTRFLRCRHVLGGDLAA